MSPDIPANPDLIVPLREEAETGALGAALAPLLQPGMRIYLRGDLGAGKTTLVRGILRALGHAGRVKSPTYTLVEVYTLSRLDLYHFDFYRFRDAHEWREAGFSDHFDGDAICLVEWPEKAGDDLPEPDLDIRIESVGNGPASSSNEHAVSSSAAGDKEVDPTASPHESRRVILHAHTPSGRQCVASLTAWSSRARSS